MKDIEILEQIKKKESESEKKIKEAQGQATKLIEKAKSNAASIVDDAKLDAASSYSSVIEQAKKNVDVERSGIMEDAVAKSQVVRKLDKPSVMKMLQKAIKNRFGV